MEGSVGPLPVLQQYGTARPRQRCCRSHPTVASLESVSLPVFELSPEVVRFLSGAALLGGDQLTGASLDSIQLPMVSDPHTELDPPQVADLMPLVQFPSVPDLALFVLPTMVRQRRAGE